MTADQCINLASVRRYWPGRNPDLVCVEHAQDSERISLAMGFHLRLEPIGYNASNPPPQEFPKCYCSKGFSHEA